MTEGQVADLFHNNVAPQLAEPVQADPRRAVIEAMASQYPELQAIGMADMQAQAKAKPYEEHVIDGKIVRSAPGGQTQVLGDFKERDEWSEPIERDVDGKRMLMQQNRKTGQWKAVGTGGTNVQINTGSKGDLSYMGEIDKSIAPGGKSYEPAAGAAKNLQLTTQALSAIDQGASTGFMEPTIQALRGLGERMGIENATTAPTDQLGGLLKDRVFSRLGSLGAQVSNSDREFIEAAQGSLSTNPKALKMLLAYAAAADMMEIQRHNKVVESRMVGTENPALFEASRINYSANLGDDEFGDMVARALQGKPMVPKGTKPAPAPAPATPRGTPLDPRIKWSDMGR